MVHRYSHRGDMRPTLTLLLAALTGVGGAEGPSLAPRQEQWVAGVVGQDAVLRCAVLRLGDKSVSWVRARDLQILTHAGAVFTGDVRVSTAERPAGDVHGSTVHELRIAHLRHSDAGRYECQLNTEPKTSLLFNLTVLEHATQRTVVVTSENTQPVQSAAGVVATLSCSARYDPLPELGEPPPPPLQIRWTRPEGEPLDATTGGRGGVSLEAERWTGGARSSLTLGDVRATDAGIYWCEAGGERARLQLRVLPSVTPAEAMLGDAAAAGSAVRLGAAQLGVTQYALACALCWALLL